MKGVEVPPTLPMMQVGPLASVKKNNNCLIALVSDACAPPCTGSSCSLLVRYRTHALHMDSLSATQIYVLGIGIGIGNDNDIGIGVGIGIGMNIDN